MSLTSLESERWFDEEIKPHEALLKAHLRRAFPTLLDLDDVVQEAYARLFRARQSGEIRHAKAFLFATARNAALDSYRRSQIVTFEPLPDSGGSFVSDQEPDVHDIVSKRQELDLLGQAVRRLPEKCRQVVTLRLVQDLPVKEIAARLGISALTVKTHLANGMRGCTAYFEEQGLLPPEKGPIVSEPDPDLDRIDATAADWLARREEGLTAPEEAQFAAWRRADPRHEEAAARLEFTWESLRRWSASSRPVPSAVEECAERRQPRSDDEARGGPCAPPAWRLWTVLIVAAAAAAVAVTWLRVRPLAPAPTFAAPSGHIRRLQLADGSVACLNADTRLEIRYSAHERALRLLAGEAQFDVRHDASRPFVVTAGPAIIRDLGTAFDVRLQGDEANVVVTEGRVSVGRPSDRQAAILLAGQSASVRPAQRIVVATLAPDERVLRLAWSEPRLEFAATPLSAAVAEFNQRNEVQIEIADPGLATLEVSGVFRADNAEGFARLLAQGGRVRVEHPKSDRILLTRPSAEGANPASP